MIMRDMRRETHFFLLYFKGDYATCATITNNFPLLSRGLHNIKAFSSKNAIKAFLGTSLRSFKPISLKKNFLKAIFFQSAVSKFMIRADQETECVSNSNLKQKIHQSSVLFCFIAKRKFIHYKKFLLFQVWREVIRSS